MRLRRRASGLRRLFRRQSDSLRHGQLDSDALESLVAATVAARGWETGPSRLVVEVGTGGGRGSTVAVHRALTNAGCSFRLVGYEGDPELAGLACRRWRGTGNVRIVNEYFMHREDIDASVKPHVTAEDRDAYFPTFEDLARRENFLETTPPGPIDLLFVDSVRYTHLAILRAARPWLRAETVVLMEDDIPGYGELEIIASELELRDVTRHEIDGHPWPLVKFSLAL